MHVELVVPGLFATGAAVRAPSLEMLLARSRHHAAAPRTLEEWLHDAFELEAPLPAGALTLLAAGGDPADHFWLRADPVHLHLLRERVAIVAAEEFDIERAQADELCAALNRHFEGAMELRAVDARRWVAMLAHQQPELDHRPALERSGRTVEPGGSGERELTEIQMVLHAHPVNEAREARADPAVNSLWLWGAGRVPASVRAPWQSVTADEPVALGLARLAGARHRALPASAVAWLERSPEEGRHLVVLDGLRIPALLSRPAEFRTGIEALERDWFTPMLAALRSGRIGMLTLHAPGASFEIIRGDLRRFWRRPKSLERYA
jgi:hypothetical protein